MIRLETIASLVDIDAKVIDIGTDHAYLPIILYKNNITKDITGSDISSEVLKQSKKNLEHHHLEDKIKLILSDGFKSITEDYDIAVISGMGTDTIKGILQSGSIPPKLIICSHNHLMELRTFMMNFGYSIDKEIVVKEKNKYYDIIKYIKGREELSAEEIIIGKSNNKEYFNHLKKHYQDLYNKSKDAKYLEIIEKILD